MSQVIEDLVGDAGDPPELDTGTLDILKESNTKTKSSDNVEQQSADEVNKNSSDSVEQSNAQVTSRASLKPKSGKNRTSLKTKSAQDDLLQAFCVDVSSLPANKANKADSGIRQQANKNTPATDGAPLKSTKQKVPAQTSPSKKSISVTKESPVDRKTIGEKPSADTKSDSSPAPSVKKTEMKVPLPQVKKVTSQTDSGPSLSEIMSEGGSALKVKVEEKKDSPEVVREKPGEKEKLSVTPKPQKTKVNATNTMKSELRQTPKREDKVIKLEVDIGNISGGDQSQRNSHGKGNCEAEKRDGIKDKTPVVSDKSKSSDSIISSQKKQQVECKGEQDPEIPSFSEEDLKNIDLFLVDQMVDNVIKQKLPPQHSSSEARYRVKVSPLEIADLAESSVHNLITEFPKISLIFKRQIGKFKKKKGYAEINFTKIMEVKDFVKKLVTLKLVDKKIEINISAWLSGISRELSVSLSLKDNHKLMSLINMGQDPQAKMPGTKHQKLQFESVPSNVTVPLLHSLFPFSTFVHISRDVQDKTSGKSLTGPVVVHFNNPKYQVAVLECFSNFTIDGHRLKLLPDNTSQGESEVQEKEQNARDKQKEKNTTSTFVTKVKKEKEMSQQSEPSQKKEMEDPIEDDDDISNMTRDVCTGMLESLDKLKQLDANNPNMEHILKMRDQLDKLQKSLDQKPREKKGHETKNRSEHEGNQEDPWEVGFQDIDGDDQSSSKDSLKHEESKSSRNGSKSKYGQKYARSESKDQDNNLLQVFETTNEPKQHQKEKARSGRSQSNAQGSDENSSSSRSRRRRDSLRSRDDNAEKSYEQRMKEEELERRKEAATKEAERIELIQKIEEARLRDLKKAEERAQNQAFWESGRKRKRDSPFSHKSSGSEMHTSSSSTSGARDKGFDRGNNRSNKRSFEETKASHDDGVDQRLAAFERELAQKGVIKSHPSPSKRPKSMGSDNFMTRDVPAGVAILMEDEYDNIIAENRHHVLPPDYRIRIQSSLNRQCPVKSCPDTKYFRDKSSFLEHWSIFHVAETTMRFCQECAAYFMSPEDLEMHLKKAHRISPNEAQFMVRQARVKVISNPSYRDPNPYLSPLR